MNHIYTHNELFFLDIQVDESNHLPHLNNNTMKTQTKNTLAVAIATLGMIGTSNAVVIFDASPGNTTLANNGIGAQGTLMGTSGNLDFQNNDSGFNFSAFASTQNVNTLNGGAITDANTVTVTVSVSGFSVGIIRANGIDFGLNNATTSNISNLETGDNIIRLEASNIGGDIGTFFNGAAFLDSSSTSTTAELTNGFTAILVADVDGYTYTLDSVGDTSPVTVSGTYAPGEFVSTVGNSHLVFAQQQFNAGNNGVNLLSNITQASIEVTTVPEPSSAALLGLGGLALIMRRRK